jgi:hypothetical protein
LPGGQIWGRKEAIATRGRAGPEADTQITADEAYPMTSEDVLERLGLTPAELLGGSLSVRSPIDGAEIARIRETPAADAIGDPCQLVSLRHVLALGWAHPHAEGRDRHGKQLL